MLHSEWHGSGVCVAVGSSDLDATAVVLFSTDQEGAEEDKGNKVEVGKITAAVFPMGP